MDMDKDTKLFREELMNTNFTKLFIAQEEKLKKKHGKNYVGPTDRYIKELIDDTRRTIKFVESKNEILPDLPFVFEENQDDLCPKAVRSHSLKVLIGWINDR